MRSYNVIQAANYIGCDPKTVRRWLEKGRLTAERTERGWLAIPGGQVEYAKIQWEKEQDQFAGPRMSRDAQGVPSGQHNDMVDRVGRLQVVVGNLTTKVTALEQRIATLEQALSNASLPVPAQPADVPPAPDKPKASLPVPMPPSPQPSSHPSIPQPKPQNRTIDIPTDWVLCSEFFKQYEIKETTYRRWLKDGLSGDRFECEKSTLPDGKTSRHFTIEQREAAIELLRKHGKI